MNINLKLSTHAVLQAVAVVAQFGNLYSGLVPSKYQPIVLAVVSLAQAILAVSNHKPAESPVQSPVTGQSQEKKS